MAGLLYLGLNWLLLLLQVDVDTIDRVIGTVSACAIWFALSESGGQACMQHLALRLVLWHSGAIPRDYADLLRYTSELRLTQQTGGSFAFSTICCASTSLSHLYPNPRNPKLLKAICLIWFSR
ncbi:MAG: hypothetical protein AAFW75_24100 [Cyanobacteria bacterium J06636_16]